MFLTSKNYNFKLYFYGQFTVEQVIVGIVLLASDFLLFPFYLVGIVKLFGLSGYLI